MICQLGLVNKGFFLQRSSILLVALVAIFSRFLEAASMDPANVATFLISFDNFSFNALSFDPIPADTLDPACIVRK